MILEEKYEAVLDLMRQQGGNVHIKEKDGKLNVAGTVGTQYEKNIIWDKIKEIGGENPKDINADIKVSKPELFAVHAVKQGETLKDIAKKYLGDENKYKQIVEANRDVLSDQEKLEPGLDIKIPNK
jgi:LysM repeat protein